MFQWLKNLFANPTEFNVPEQISDKEVSSLKDTTAPKVSDYQRSDYSVYWEIINEESKEHGYKAILRLNSYMGGVVDEIVFVSRSKEDLKKQVYRAIPGKMNKYRKGT
jgi:hypothetical protein